MLNIPQELLVRFVAILEKRGVPSAQHNYFKKWLRYYLDFCDKYRLKATSSKEGRVCFGDVVIVGDTFSLIASARNQNYLWTGFS
jgi:hypothetical protein